MITHIFIHVLDTLCTKTNIFSLYAVVNFRVFLSTALQMWSIKRLETLVSGGTETMLQSS